MVMVVMVVVIVVMVVVIEVMVVVMLGKPIFPKSDKFPENFRKGGGGVISDPKNFVANLVRFGPVWKKNRNIFFRKSGVRGRSEIFRKFIDIGKDGLP